MENGNSCYAREGAPIYAAAKEASTSDATRHKKHEAAEIGVENGNRRGDGEGAC